MHKFYDYEPNWIFNWDTNEPINSRLFLAFSSSHEREEKAATEAWRENKKLLFAIFMHDGAFHIFLEIPRII
jgi:hypothetical protein